MHFQRQIAIVKLTCRLIIFFSVLIGSFARLPPEPQEWEVNPNIFATWPKISSDEHKSHLKSPTVGTVHKYLPRTTFPIEYRIKMTMILESEIEEEELLAPGSVGILVKCVEATDEIVLHVNVKYVTIIEESVKVYEAKLGKPINSRPIAVLNQTYEVDHDFYIIRLASPCKVQKEYLVEIRFVTEIATDTLTGLYLSTYLDPVTNTTKRLATTQFEAEHARQMFPNYDDPDFKAVFKVIIGRHGKYNSMSNMNLIKTEENKDRPGWFWDHYPATPKMSSYLLAVIVSEFTCVQAPPPGYKKLVDVCGPPHMIAKGGGLHSAEVAATILGYYDSFMKQEYPLPKMTSVAIPDFQAGAMENWGLNTYRVRALMFYPNITSEEYRYRVDLVIAHELAHQNWGNLVTTKLWNQIWLNEGFATYISYFGLKSVSPEFEPDKQWLTGYRRRALLMDSSVDTHPLVNISSPMFYFDGISYSKGASLLKMMENFLTPRVFHEALRAYLAKHAYGTATQWDLFDILERHAVIHGVRPSIASVIEIMESWTLQPGYPLIKVEYVSNRAILVTQEIFIDSPQEGPTPLRYWYIPITMLYDGLQQPTVPSVPTLWLSDVEPAKVIYTETNFKWIVVNPDASAFARVLYDELAAKQIEDQLNTAHEVFSAVTRAQIIEDAFEVAWAGYGRIETALNYTRYLGQELEPVVWSSALSGLGRIYAMFATDETVISHFKEYVFERIASSLATIGVEQASHEKGMSVLHRGSLLHWAGILEIPDAIQHAVTKVQTWADSSVNSIPPDLHSQTYCNAIIGGEKVLYDTLLHLFKNASDIDVKAAIARSLGCTKSESILAELRQNLTMNEFIVKPDMRYDLMLKLSRNSVARKDLLKYFDENFNEIQTRFDGVIVIAKGLETAAQYWNTHEQLEQVQAFIEKYRDDLDDVERILKKTVRQIRENISWMERFSDSVKAWFKNN